MHAQDERKFPAMMQIVFNEMPQDELAGETLLSGEGWRKDLLQIGNRPAHKGLLHDLQVVCRPLTNSARVRSGGAGLSQPV